MILSITLSTVTIITITALGYVVATVGMKLAAHGEMSVGLALALGGFAAAFLAEVALLRRADLSLAYVVVIGAETLLVLFLATMIGEGLNLRQTAGAVLVLTGLCIVSV